jgi:hypothetical protein
MDSKEKNDEKLAMNGSSPDMEFSSPKRKLIEAKERDAYFDKEVSLLLFSFLVHFVYKSFL